MTNESVEVKPRIPSCLFLILFGFLGMTFSEVLSWNMGPIIRAQANGGWIAIRTVVIAHVLYIVLFAGFAMLIQRYKVNSWTGIVLLGSIYGLINEGVFANLLYRAGFLPVILGLRLDRILFPTLSWHAFIDFALVLYILKAIVKGRINFSSNKITSKEILGTCFISFYWFFWMKARWMSKILPDGVPLALQIIIISWVCLAVGFLLYATSKSFSNESLPVRSGGLIFAGWLAFIAFFVLIRFKSMQFKLQFVGFILLLVFYSALFFFDRKFVHKTSKESIIDDICLSEFSFNPYKYLKLCGILTLCFVIFQLLVKAPLFVKLCSILSVILLLIMMITALIFPLFIVINVFYNILQNKKSA